MPGSRLRMRAAPSNSSQHRAEDGVVTRHVARFPRGRVGPVPRKRLSVAPRRQVRQATRRSSQLTDTTTVQRSAARGTVTYTGRSDENGRESNHHRPARARPRLPDDLAEASRPRLRAIGCRVGRLRPRPRRSRRRSRTRGHPRDRLPRQALDDAPVRRVRHARRDQRALSSTLLARRRHRPQRRASICRR